MNVNATTEHPEEKTGTETLSLNPRRNEIMTNMWNLAQELSDKHENSNGIFVRLVNNGDKIVGAFCGEPHAREVHWTGEKYEKCTGDANCPICKTGKKPSLRVALNLFSLAEKSMKVIEGGAVWFRDILKVRDKYGLATWIFEVERHGEAKDPKTTYSILPEVKLSEEQKALIAAVKLHDLEAVCAGTQNGNADAAQPISEQSATELIGHLKTLPRQEVEALLETFGITRVRELTTACEQPFRGKLAELLVAKEGSQPKEVDPFA